MDIRDTEDTEMTQRDTEDTGEMTQNAQRKFSVISVPPLWSLRPDPVHGEISR